MSSPPVSLFFRRGTGPSLALSRQSVIASLQACLNSPQQVRHTNENRNQDRTPKPQAVQKHPVEWQAELNPAPLEGQNIGLQAEQAEMTDRVPYEIWNRLISEEKPGQR
jgi:hypothetical protein